MALRMTDAGNAERLLETYGADIRYCPEMKSWYFWDGRIWVRDTNNHIIQYAKHVARSYNRDLKYLEEDNPVRQKVVRWAANSESSRNLRAMVEIAQTDNSICVDSSMFDTHPNLFNVMNGTIDMATGDFYPFEREDYLTMLAPVTYDPSAQCPLFMDSFRQSIPDHDTRIFLQAAAGYSLSGETIEEKMFILHGEGRNGKTTFVNTLLSLLGPYGAQASSQMLQRSNSTGAKDDLFALMGKRLVVATETAENHLLDENLIKQMTGGNRVSVNPKWKTQMEFTPTWKLWLDTNYEPVVTGNDYAIWSRLIKIPFTIKRTEAQIDKTLKRRLMTDMAERSGILNWALEGYALWKAVGLIPSAEIKLSTDNYRMEYDLISKFVTECCILSPNRAVTKGALYEAYVNFCRRFNEKPKTINAFGRDLGRKCLKGSRTNSERYWTGIGINNSVHLLPSMVDNEE